MLSVLLVIANFITTRSFVLAALFSIIPLELFSIGQTYTFQVIENKFITNDMYPLGRELLYVLTPATIVYTTTLIHFLILFIRKKIPKFSVILSFFLLGIFFIILSSTKAEYFRVLSLFYSLGIFFRLVLFLDLYNYLRTKRKKIQKHVLNTILSQIIICIVFISIVALLQFLKRNTLGIHIEAVNIVPIFGRGSDENPLQFRPVGLSVHANILAKQIFELLATVISLSIVLFKNKKLMIKTSVIKITFILAISTILLTQSRSVYLALIPFIIFPLIYLRKQTKVFMHKLMLFISNNKFAVVIMFFIISSIVPNRFLLSLSTLSSGGLVVREKLNVLAVQLIHNKPILGTGTGTFIPAAFKIDQPGGVMSYFPEAVHNGILLIAVENGLISLLAFYIAYYLLLRRVRKSKLSKYKHLIYAGFLGQLIIMMFQPFAILLPLNVLILILLTELSMI